MNGKPMKTGVGIWRLMLGKPIAAWIVLGVLALSQGGCITSTLIMRHHLRNGGYLEEWHNEDGEQLAEQVYDQTKDLKYDMFIPRDAKRGTTVPLLLFIHGGAWNSGSRYDIAYACKYYAKHGCIAATLDYSLVSSKRPEVTIYTMLDEITRCIGAIKDEVARRGYRTPAIALGGFSAGGHLALLYSYSRADESPIPVAFVCEKVGPSDFSEKAFGKKISAQLVSGGTGKTVAVADLEKPEVRRLVESLSPVSFITGSSVPTIFAYGGKDDLVKRYHRDALADALKKNGVPHVAIDFPNSHHAMWSDPDKTEEFRKAVLLYCQTYMSAASSAAEEIRPQTSSGTGVRAVADEICSIAGVEPVGTTGVVRVDFTLRAEAGSDIRCRAELPPPEKWDGRFWGKGNSGVGGKMPKLNVSHMTGASLPAMVTTDLGTRAVVKGCAMTTSIWPVVVQRDYNWRATHLMTVYGKRIVKAFYGRAANNAYFIGGSCGGRQAIHEAMRFPADYDGIVASLPANNVVPNRIGKWYLWRTTHDGEGRALFTKEEMRVVADAAVEFRAASDPKPYAGYYLADGRATDVELDGMLALAARQCPSLRQGDKMARLKAIYSPVVVDGACLSLGFAPGTYLGEKFGVRDDALLRTWLGTKDGALTNWCHVSWDHLREYAREAGPEQNANPADLSAFFSRGGKLIMTTGWEDQTIPPGPIVDHYERICAQEGGIEKAMDHCRLFCMPGVAHGGGKGRATQGAAGTPSLTKAIVEWVENGKAPDRIIVRDGTRKMDFPVATYPGLFVKDEKGEWIRVERPRSKPRLSPEVISAGGR